MSDSSTSGMEVDLSDQSLKRLDRRDGIGVETLRLDNNQLQKLENLDCFLDVWKLSAAHNQLNRMYYISKLHRLTHVDLSHNQILSIEGLKDLRHLQWLSLANNKLKSLQNIQFSVSLVHLDVSDNQIANLMDISSLTKLKTLLLNRNCIQSLERAPLYFPAALSVLGLAENKISDLTMISFLTKLPSLEALAFFGNPCYLEKEPFDYRPYIINWCLGLRVLDDYVVTQRESLKAEWLYSQGKGRFFTIGQHQPLIEYLQQICPKQEPDDELEDRISRVLAMQRQHKEQLLHEMSPLSARRPRSAVGRLGGAERTSGGRQWGDKMSQSLLEESTHSESFEKKNVCTELSTNKSSSGSSHRSRRDNIMTRSVPDLPPTHPSSNRVIPTPSNHVMSSSQIVARTQASDNRSGSSRVSRSSSYSVPRKVTKTATVQPHRTTALYRKEKDKGEIERLKARREFLHKSATRIQAAWRGYITRKKQEKEIQHLRMRRVEEHLMHFVRRMEQLETTVRRQEQELAEEKNARLANQEMLGRMLNSMDNIERHLQAICVSETPVEAPVISTSPTKQILAGEDVEMQRSDTIESLSTRLSRLESVIMNLSANF